MSTELYVIYRAGWESAATDPARRPAPLNTVAKVGPGRGKPRNQPLAETDRTGKFRHHGWLNHGGSARAKSDQLQTEINLPRTPNLILPQWMFQLSYWHLNRRGLGGFRLIINKYEKGRIKRGVKKRYHNGDKEN